MIVIRMELWPGGDQTRAIDLGVGVIANQGETGANTHPPYSVRLLKSARFSKRAGETWRSGTVAAYPRNDKRWGPWELLALALEATIGDRVQSLKRYRHGGAMRSCWECKHLRFERGLPETPDWSEYTPGESAIAPELECCLSHWAIDFYEDTEGDFRTKILSAETCVDFQEFQS